MSGRFRYQCRRAYRIKKSLGEIMDILTPCLIVDEHINCRSDVTHTKTMQSVCFHSYPSRIADTSKSLPVVNTLERFIKHR